jgi:hypothetical protein
MVYTGRRMTGTEETAPPLAPLRGGLQAQSSGTITTKPSEASWIRSVSFHVRVSITRMEASAPPSSPAR